MTTFQIIVLFTTSNSKMALLLLRNNARSHFHVKNVRFVSQAMKLVNEKLDLELEGIKAAGTWKSERVITSKQDIEINVDGSQGKILNFCANNYLGLSVSLKKKVIVALHQNHEVK